MSIIVLDMGSGNGGGNHPARIKDMIDAVKDADTGKHKVYLKYQLFRDAPPNVPLTPTAFKYAYEYGKLAGYQVTASVFDMYSLYRLMEYEVPFVKIANRPELYGLAQDIVKDNIYISYTRKKDVPKGKRITPLCCISKYPATGREYEESFTVNDLQAGISDHTVGFDLAYQYMPRIWEKHFVLERDASNPDAGPFAMVPEDLKELMEVL